MDKKIDYSKVNTWPFQEAKKILARIGHKIPAKGYVLFETGYGPSGLPHIGTFGEVARTSMVRWAFSKLSDIPTRLIAFSDDMDGLRKVPSNIPNQEEVAKYLGFPLTGVPDPFGKYKSFADHNNAMLRDFLDSYGFEYEFRSSTDMYKSGAFNDALMKILANYDKIMNVMLPTLGEERRKTYSPIMPISPTTGRVLQVPVLAVHPEKGTIEFEDEDGKRVEQSVLNGKAKLQWKADWAMRWLALNVDYEMCGADLTESYKLSSQIVKIIGGKAPENLTYQLFTDEQGQKISKTKGNGISIEEWLKYANPESLALFMCTKPTSGKRLYFDVIPRNVDEYYQHLNAYDRQTPQEQMTNPAVYIHRDKGVPTGRMPIPYNLLLNLASAANTTSVKDMWGYISAYKPGLTAGNSPDLNKMAQSAVHYFHDFVEPNKKYRPATDQEKIVLMDLSAGLSQFIGKAGIEKALEEYCYNIGKKYYGTEKLREFFSMFYNVLLGQENGPRLPNFIQIYGIEKTQQMINKALSEQNELLKTMQQIQQTTR